MLYLKHPAWLWLKKHDKKRLPPIDDNLQAMFDAGNRFEAYAEQLFPNSVRLGFNDYYQYLDLPARTTKAIADGAKTIFQGRFEYKELTFICDVIQFVEDKVVDLIEIKSSTKAKIDHEYDLAFQMVVLEGCGYEVRNISVVHVNNSYVRHGDIDATQMTATTDITEAVKARRSETLESIEAAIKVVDSKTRPDISPAHAKLGSFNEWLAIYEGLEPVEPGSIYELATISAETVAELESRNITRLIDIPDDIQLSPKQQLQLKATKANAPIIDRGAIKKYLDSMVYPLFFFDYETLASVVPYFDGMSPYAQYPFQYSLHILDKPGGELRHFEYLHSDNSNPAESLTKTLQSQIGNSGSVITWYMSFEMGCNTRIGTMLPEFADFYDQLNVRVVDLMIPFSNGWYADKEFFGSASIKKVLPVLVPELSYKTQGIQEGAAAQRLWMEAVLDGKRDDEKGQILANLIKYCELDTFAMVEIYRFLIRLIDSGPKVIAPVSPTDSHSISTDSDSVPVQISMF